MNILEAQRLLTKEELKNHLDNYNSLAEIGNKYKIPRNLVTTLIYVYNLMNEEEFKNWKKECYKQRLTKRNKESKGKSISKSQIQKRIDTIKNNTNAKKQEIKELLIKLYIDENHTIKETTYILNNDYNMKMSQRTIQRRINELELKKTQEQISETRIKTNLENYGVENTYQSEEIKNKIKKTKLEKYGDENYNNSKKYLKTLKNKYGVSSPMLLQSSQETIKKKYGGHQMLSEDVKDKIKRTNIEKYGVPWYCMTDDCKNANGHTTSKINIKMHDLLNENNIDNKLEFTIKDKSYDIHVLNTNILLEINPTYTHNSTYSKWFHNHETKPLAKDYHYNKSLLAKENGYHCIHVFDWDDIDKIINIIKPKEKIFARKCKIKEVDNSDVKQFEILYHLQGYCNNQSIRLGLYYNNELVEIMTFGKPRYNKNYEYELIRLCSHKNYIIIGGSEKLFKHFIEKYKPNSIISYCDNSKFNGDIYSKLGFDLKSYGKPSKHWWNGKRHITDNLLRSQGFDRLFNTNYGKGTSNEQLMIENNFVEIYDSGQSTYVWKL